MPRITETELKIAEDHGLAYMAVSRLIPEIRALQQDVARSEEVIAIAVQQRDAMAADRAKLLEALKITKGIIVTLETKPHIHLDNYAEVIKQIDAVIEEVERS